MSTINVTNLKGRGGASPNLPDGANITGVVTATTFSGTLDGSLKTTGTPTLGLGVTINASGVAISGVATAGILSATTLYGDGTNLTGVGESIAPWHYNPDVNDTSVAVDTGIGITFNKKVSAGSGTATIKIVNAGVAGTTVQSWGISSATIGITDITLGALVSNLTVDKTYQLDIPEGFLVSSTGTNYAGTAYTFTVQSATGKLWATGRGSSGQLGQGDTVNRSSPVQIPGNTWDFSALGEPNTVEGNNFGAVRTDGTLWTWGNNQHGALGHNGTAGVESPVQVPGTTWATYSAGYYASLATKTDGTLWAWGYNGSGALGQNHAAQRSSPVQIPGTTWLRASGGRQTNAAIKTDGTLWTWGRNHYGELGENSAQYKSSPVQVPGTTWKQYVYMPNNGSVAVKTDGTLWTWGTNGSGRLGLNDTTERSSPTQIPGTTWNSVSSCYLGGTATRTDGTLWTWGWQEDNGSLGNSSRVSYSSPIQIPGTNWNTGRQGTAGSGHGFRMATKTDGTLWAWGTNVEGAMGTPSVASGAELSSPVQVPGTEWDGVATNGYSTFIKQLDQTP